MAERTESAVHSSKFHRPRQPHCALTVAELECCSRSGRSRSATRSHSATPLACRCLLALYRFEPCMRLISLLTLALIGLTLAGIAPLLCNMAEPSAAASSSASASVAPAYDAVAAAAARLPNDGPAPRSLSLLLLGATGRTGLPFLTRALDRGHRVTAVVRNASKLDASLTSNPLLTCVEASLDEGAPGAQDRINAAVASAKPEVILTMLASDPKPHNGVSNGARVIVSALRANPPPAGSPPIPLLTIGGWGMAGPSEQWVKQGSFANRMVGCVGGWFFSNIIADFKLSYEMMSKAEAEGLIRTTKLQPPFLTNGARTKTYQFGDAHLFKSMNAYSTVSRNDLADAALRLAEQAAEGEKLPEFVAVKSA